MFVNAFKGTKRRDALERVSRAGSAIAPIVLAFLALESCVGSLLALLYRDRRRGEIVTLVVLLTLSVSGLLPAILSNRMENVERRPLGQPRGTRPVPRGEEPAPLPTPATPEG